MLLVAYVGAVLAPSRQSVESISLALPRVQLVFLNNAACFEGQVFELLGLRKPISSVHLSDWVHTHMQHSLHSCRTHSHQLHTADH